jgi:hypothetical protein
MSTNGFGLVPGNTEISYWSQASGDQHRSFCSSFMQNGHKYGLNSKEASWLAGTLYGAGYNTVNILP